MLPAVTRAHKQDIREAKKRAKSQTWFGSKPCGKDTEGPEARFRTRRQDSYRNRKTAASLTATVQGYARRGDFPPTGGSATGMGHLNCIIGQRTAATQRCMHQCRLSNGPVESRPKIEDGSSTIVEGGPG